MIAVCISLAIPKARRDIRIRCRKGCCGESGLLKHRRKRVLSRCNSQNISPQRQWIAGCQHRGHRIVSWSARRDCILENDTLPRETIQERRCWALIPKEAHVVCAHAIDGDQNERMGVHEADPICAARAFHDGCVIETFTFSEPSANCPLVTIRYRSSSLAYNKSGYFVSSAVRS